VTSLTITALGQRGDGVAEHEGRPVFVPFALPGERVEAEIAGGRGALSAVLKPSPNRIEPFCPYFGVCGGCALQHLAPAPYAAFKRGLVETALRQAGLGVPVGPLVDARGQGRRRATLHVRGGRAGYMRAHTHELLDIDACPILVPALRSAAPRLARALASVAGDCEARFTLSDTGIDLDVRPVRKVRPEAFASFGRANALSRISVNGEPVFMAQQPTIVMGPATVPLPPASFLQATAAAEEALAALVLEAVGKAKSVGDLFCGLGPFALRLAKTARVAAFDGDRPAIAALQHAVRHTSGLKPVRAEVRDLFRDPLAPVELAPHDAVILDPPRAGARAQAGEIARSAVSTVIAVSCDPGTFARDAAILVNGGYRLEKVTPVDQFAYAPHVEMVGVFRK
jgi:23S rRNA (uracil1939-C5)-methyltransferase